jgi:hypothetical protein
MNALNYWITYENNGKVIEECFDKPEDANAKFDELKNTPDLQNVTLYATLRYCSVTN